LPQPSLKEVKLLDQVTEEQASEATAPPLELNQACNAAPFPFPSHSTVKSEAAVEICGLVVSCIVKVAVEVSKFPQESVAVKITVAEPVLPQPSLKAVKLLDQVTEEQASEATAPPLELNQACNAAPFPFPSHSTVKSEAVVEICGLVVSCIVKVAVEVSKLPQESVAVKITVAEPVLPQPSLNSEKLLDHVTDEQLSDATAPPLEFNQACNASPFPFPSHSTVKLEAEVEICGLIVSCIVKVAVEVSKFPQLSVAVKVTLTAAEQSFAKALKLLDQVTEEQASEATVPPLELNQACSASVFPLPSHSTIVLLAAVVICGLVVS